MSDVEVSYSPWQMAMTLRFEEGKIILMSHHPAYQLNTGFLLSIPYEDLRIIAYGLPKERDAMMHRYIEAHDTPVS